MAVTGAARLRNSKRSFALLDLISRSEKLEHFVQSLAD
jgi:hypothetical protein